MSDNTHRGDALIPMKTVVQPTGLCDQSIRNMMAKGRFPKSIALTTRCVRWSQQEIEGWIEERKAER